MTTYNPPKYATEYIFYVFLVSQANTKIFKANPTLADGDLTVCVNDEAPQNVSAYAVDADNTKRVKVTLSSAQMTGENISFMASDVTGAEWCDYAANFQPAINQIETFNYAGEWLLDQANSILFIMVDSSGNEVAGIGDGNLTVELSKNGGAFAAGAGVNTEVSDGWYKYTGTAADADTLGPIAVKVTGTGATQQNLEYVVKQRNASAIEFTYTVLDTLANPIEGVQVWITTDVSGNNIIWNGNTDALGIALDINSEKPFLDAGTYYFWSQKAGYSFPNPDTETVS